MTAFTHHLAAAVAGLTLVNLPPVGGSPAAATPAACDEVPSSGTGTSGRFAVRGVHIRTGPGPECWSRGLGYPEHQSYLTCNKLGSDGQWWTYLRDVTTNTAGWSRTDLLTNPAMEHCS